MNTKEYRVNINKRICEYITIRFLSDFYKNDHVNTQNKYAKAVGLTSSTIGKIKAGGYNIPLSTIASILKYENVKIEVFFADFKEYFEKGNI